MEGLNTTANVTQHDNVDIELICRSTIVISISTITIIGHSLNIRAIPYVSSLDMSSATKLLYTALSVADILTCIALISGNIVDIVGQTTGYRSEVVCKLTGLLMTCAPGTSAIFILLLNVERFIYISRPLLYHSIVSRRKTAIAVGIAIPYVSVSVVIYSFSHDRSLSIIREHESISVCKVAFSQPSFLPYTLVMFSCNMWLVAVILIIMYSKIIMISRHHLARIEAHQQVLKRVRNPQAGNSGSGNPPDSTGDIRTAAMAAAHFDTSFAHSFRQNIRTLRTPLMITGCYLLSWMPFSLVETYIAVTDTTYLLNGYLYKVVATTAASNSSINLLVYYLSRGDLRQAMKRNVCNRENL